MASASFTLNSHNRTIKFTVTQTSQYGYSWELAIQKDSSSGSNNVTAHKFHFYINGVQVYDMSGISGYNSSGDYLPYTTGVFPARVTASGSSWDTTSGSTTVNTLSAFTISGQGGYNSAGEVQSGSATLTPDIYATTPVINNPSISSITTSSAYSEFTVANDGGAAIVDHYQDIFTDAGCTNKVGTIGRTGTFTGLSAGTTYWVRANASNGYYRGYSNVVQFTTIYAAPTSVSINPVADRTSINLNRSWSGSATECQYNINNLGWLNENGTYSGTTIRCSGNTVSGLQPNTQYSCKIRLRNNNSSWTTSSESIVTTTANAPTIAKTITATSGGFNITPTVTPDTNVNLTSVTLDYGTTSSYGTSETLTNGSVNQITGLAHNTLYYLQIVALDSLNQTSTDTDTITTDGDAPVLTGISSTVTSTSISYTIDATFDTNDSFASGTLTYGLVGGTTTTIIINSLSGTLNNLNPGKEYSLSTTITSTLGKTSTLNNVVIKTHGGMHYMGREAIEAKLNGHVILGMRINGNDIL